MSTTQNWYQIQYDIRDTRRGQRMYRFLKSCAFSLQASVFAWQGNSAELAALQQRLKGLINVKEDDIRGYQLRHPLMLFGASPFVSDVYFSGYPAHQHTQRAELLQQPAAAQ